MDVTENGAKILQNFNIESGNYTSAGEAAEQIKKTLKQLGVDAALVRKIAIASYEVEMNLVIHAYGGNLTFEINPKEVSIISQDEGPGIEDIELAMVEGYSTAPDTARELGFGAGMGLANMRRCSDRFNIHSEVGVGTRVEMIFDLK